MPVVRLWNVESSVSLVYKQLQSWSGNWSEVMVYNAGSAASNDAPVERLTKAKDQRKSAEQQTQAKRQM